MGKTRIKHISGKDVLGNPDSFLKEKYSTKIEGSFGVGFDFSINLDKNSADFSFFKRGIELGTQRAVSALRDALDAAISSNVWSWPGGSRDIVETGELRDSLNVSISSNGLSVEYGAPYAALMHYGGYIQPYGNLKIDKVYIPGRPWADSVLLGGGPVSEFDWQTIYSDAILQEFR